MIDLHTHVLPGIDDGPATMEQAVELARVAVAGGTRTMVATPHIDHFNNVRPSELAGRLAVLEQTLETAGIDLEVLGGGEIALTRLPELSESERGALGLGGGPYLLLESPLSMAAGSFEGVILHQLAAGSSVLLAHPERCPAFQRDLGRLRRLVDAGALCQITAGSMAGDFGSHVRKFTLELLSEELVHVVSSDAHDAVRRPPGLVDAFPAAYEALPQLHLQVAWLTEHAPAAILAGRPLPERPLV